MVKSIKYIVKSEKKVVNRKLKVNSLMKLLKVEPFTPLNYLNNFSSKGG